MNRICKYALPLVLALCLCLSACTSSEATPSEGSTSGSAGAEAVTPQSTVSEGSLKEYAQELSGLYGQDFPASVYWDKAGDAILYDSSQVPTQVMGTVVADLDGDGQDELAAAVLNDDHSFRLELYQEQNGQVVKTDTLDLSDEWADLPQIIGTPDYVSIADFFTYGEDRTLIGLEISQSAGTFVDGVKIDFLAVSCQNDTLKLEGHASYSGSDGIYGEDYMSTLARLGVYPPWQDLFFQNRYVREYLPNYTDFLRISTSYTVDWKEATEWLENGTEPLECASIHFSAQEELSENTQTTRDAFQPAPEHAAALQKYESALVHFAFDREWPDGENLEEMEGGMADFTENQYAIADVDGDGVPELILQFSQTYTAAQMEQVWRYDSEKDSLRQELVVYPFCTYYDNGVVKACAAHNHTNSEFWPFSLYRFNADSGEFDYIGSAYAQDKGYSDSEPFPADADKDGDGRVFFLDEDSAIDNADFEAWEQSFLNGAKELTLNWQKMNYDGYDSILGYAPLG